MPQDALPANAVHPSKPSSMSLCIVPFSQPHADTLQHWIDVYLCIPELQRAPGASLLPPIPSYLCAFPEFHPALPARSRAPATASPLRHFECFKSLSPSLQFLELSALVYKPCKLH